LETFGNHTDISTLAARWGVDESIKKLLKKKTGAKALKRFPSVFRLVPAFTGKEAFREREINGGMRENCGQRGAQSHTRTKCCGKKKGYQKVVRKKGQPEKTTRLAREDEFTRGPEHSLESFEMKVCNAEWLWDGAAGIFLAAQAKRGPFGCERLGRGGVLDTMGTSATG